MLPSLLHTVTGVQMVELARTARNGLKFNINWLSYRLLCNWRTELGTSLVLASSLGGAKAFRSLIKRRRTRYFRAPF